jgi:hypothetical protein
MASSRMTRSELEEENDMLRARLTQARDLIDETLDIEEVDPDEADDEDDEADEMDNGL